jgi:hypothetical protein
VVRVLCFDINAMNQKLNWDNGNWQYRTQPTKPFGCIARPVSMLFWDIYILVGGLEHDFYFPFHIWDGIILLIDEVLFFKMVIAPPTRSEIRCLDSN